MYLAKPEKKKNIGRHQRSGRLRAEGAGVGRPGELRGALGASWASPPLLGLLSGSGITSLGGGSWRLEAWGGGRGTRKWLPSSNQLALPVVQPSRCVTTIHLIIFTLPEARMSSSESSEEEQGGDSEVRK